MKRAAGKKDQLVSVAEGLFNQHGFNAVGVDRIIAESGVAKTTLYRYFETKEDLIVAVLARRDLAFRTGMRGFVEAASSSPAERLLSTFDFLQEWFTGEGFFGCPFMSASSEFSDPRNPIFQEVRMHKKLVLTYFEELARAADLLDPPGVAVEINLLHEGAVSIAQVTGNPMIASLARQAAARWLLGRSDSQKD